jgi:hypothetical protein
MFIPGIFLPGFADDHARSAHPLLTFCLGPKKPLLSHLLCRQIP